MFTGIIQAQGKLAAKKDQSNGAKLKITLGALAAETIVIGDSICCNGVCLTATSFADGCFWADVSAESLKVTTLGRLGLNDVINLELAMQPSGRLGGHIVSGHVDGVAKVAAITAVGEHAVWRFIAPNCLSHYIAQKGSVTIDGVSLTVNAVAGSAFEVNIIPQTFSETRFNGYKVNSEVNLEVDIIARYLERLLGREPSNANGLSREALQKAGFIG